MSRILIVSSSAVSRAGVASLLGQAGLESVGQAPGPGGLMLGPADLLVLIPESGDELDAWLDQVEGAVVLVIGPVSRGDRLRAVLSGRPWGYLQSDVTPERLAAAVAALEHGLVVMEPARGGENVDAEGGRDDLLSPREREVLELLGLGLPNKTIAHRLGISEHTAKFHVASVLAKLGASTRAEAVRIGASRGMVTL